MSSVVPQCLEHPFTMVDAGPTMSGKTYFVRELLITSDRIQPPPQRIVWVYSEWQPEYDKLKKHFGSKIEFVHGWSGEIYNTFEPRLRNVLVLDDVMGSSKNDAALSDLFTKGASHRNLSVIFITQNLYFQGKAAIDIRRNSQYVVLFRCRQDKKTISQYANQVFPDNPKFMLNAFNDATSVNHGHLLVDLKPTCPDEFMLRSNVLRDDAVVYMTPAKASLIYDGSMCL